MKMIEHLTEEQITGYDKRTLDYAEDAVVGSHILSCAECREKVPLPSVEMFWQAIMTDEINEDAIETEKLPVFSALASVWRFHSKMLLTGGTAAVLVLLSALTWINFTGSDNELAVNHMIDNKLAATSAVSSEKTNSVDENSQESINFANRPETRPIEVKGLKKGAEKSASRVNTNQKRINEKNGLFAGQKIEISQSRGNEGTGVRCGEEGGMKIELSAKEEKVVFRWKKIPDAAKYHLYISDENEILIDEYETPDETSFVLKKQLDPLKTYRWSIIITLENGKKIAGPSSKFTVKDFQKGQIKAGRQQSSASRCTTKFNEK